jgi:hypothetical protein
VELLHDALPASTPVVAIDPGEVSNRVWLSSGASGTVVEPPVRAGAASRPGVTAAAGPQHSDGSDPGFAMEATGGLHQVSVRELDQRLPESVRSYAPSGTTAARAQLGPVCRGR